MTIEDRALLIGVQFAMSLASLDAPMRVNFGLVAPLVGLIKNEDLFA